jgi:ABC-type transport system involved in cytochrome c biogenesis permease subunit
MLKQFTWNVFYLVFLGLLTVNSFAYQDAIDVPKVDVDAFGKIIVLDEGRQKPLDTYARTKLLQFSGKSTVRIGGEKWTALEWFARLFFTPNLTKEDEVFRVANVEVLEAMKLDLEEARRYSYTQLGPGLEKLTEIAVNAQQIPVKEQSAVDAEIIRLFTNITTYINLAASFQFAIPVPVFAVQDSVLARELNLPYNQKLSYVDLRQKANTFQEIFQKIKVKEPDTWSVREQESIRLTQKMYQWAQFYKNIPFFLFPLSNEGTEMWRGSWDVLGNVVWAQKWHKEIEILNQLAKAYLNGDQNNFDRQSQAFVQGIVSNPQGNIEISSGDLEVLYNKGDFFYRAELLYGLSCLLFLFVFIKRSRLLYRIGIVSIGIALLLHTVGMLLRIIIMERPPVTNLYETFVFVGWFCVILGLCVEWLQRKSLGALVAAFSGVSLLLISGKYVKEGDTLGMLVAVLDSNFWLSTHVITISMGYAGTCAAGVAGHVYAVMYFFKRTKKKALKEVFKATYGLAAFGLLLSFIGTILGGIWADQSWGRFWGWDPKENGALLIVLWVAILFHARLGGMIRDFGFAVGSAFGIAVVMFAWFGVNLLGVGLHSYGFTSGVFERLMAYYAFQVVFIVVVLCLYWYKGKITHQS